MRNKTSSVSESCHILQLCWRWSEFGLGRRFATSSCPANWSPLQFYRIWRTKWGSLSISPPKSICSSEKCKDNFLHSANEAQVTNAHCDHLHFTPPGLFQKSFRSQCPNLRYMTLDFSNAMQLHDFNDLNAFPVSLRSLTICLSEVRTLFSMVLKLKKLEHLFRTARTRHRHTTAISQISQLLLFSGDFPGRLHEKGVPELILPGSLASYRWVLCETTCSAIGSDELPSHPRLGLQTNLARCSQVHLSWETKRRKKCMRWLTSRRSARTRPISRSSTYTASVSSMTPISSCCPGIRFVVLHVEAINRMPSRSLISGSVSSNICFHALVSSFQQLHPHGVSIFEFLLARERISLQNYDSTVQEAHDTAASSLRWVLLLSSWKVRMIHNQIWTRWTFRWWSTVVSSGTAGLEDKYMRDVEWEQSVINELDLTSTELSEETLRDVLGRIHSFQWLGLGYCEFFTDKVGVISFPVFLVVEKKKSLHCPWHVFGGWACNVCSLQILDEMSRKGKLNGLKALDISHTVSLSEGAIFSLLKKHGAKLQALMIAGKPKLAEQFFLNVIPFMPKIKWVRWESWGAIRSRMEANGNIWSSCMSWSKRAPGEKACPIGWAQRTMSVFYCAERWWLVQQTAGFWRCRLEFTSTRSWSASANIVPTWSDSKSSGTQTPSDTPTIPASLSTYSGQCTSLDWLTRVLSYLWRNFSMESLGKSSVPLHQCLCNVGFLQTEVPVHQVPHVERRRILRDGQVEFRARRPYDQRAHCHQLHHVNGELAPLLPRSALQLNLGGFQKKTRVFCQSRPSSLFSSVRSSEIVERCLYVVGSPSPGSLVLFVQGKVVFFSVATVKSFPSQHRFERCFVKKFCNKQKFWFSTDV